MLGKLKSFLENVKALTYQAAVSMRCCILYSKASHEGLYGSLFAHLIQTFLGKPQADGLGLGGGSETEATR